MRRTLVALCAALMLLVGAGDAQAFTNGNAPSSAMSPIATGVHCIPLQGQLENQAAAGWNSMALAAGEDLAISGCDSAYRPYSRQVYYREYWCGQGLCGNAAVPGTSNHGLGLAVDVPQAIRGYIDLHGKRFGFCKCWSDAPQEWWHVKFNPAIYRRPNPGPHLHSPILRRHSGGPGQNVYVRKIQKLLRGHGDKTVVVDGSFGHNTTVAVKRFQKANRLPVNGVVSKRVWKRLRRPISKPVKTTPKHVPSGGSPAPAPPHRGKHHHKKKHHHHRKPRNHKAWGVDLSSNNGCSIDFKAVRHDGATFAITKATQGTTYVNPCFGRAQVRAIGAADLVPGVYHYLDPGSSTFHGSSGRAEAAFFAQAIGHAGYGKGFIQPVVDVEKTHVSDARLCHYLGEFVHTLKKVVGEKPIVYTYPGFIEEHLGGCNYLNHYRLWIAHLGVSHPTVPSPWSSWAMWQYTWTAKVAGVAGDVDVSKIYGGTRALSKLRVRELPKRARLAPRAKVSLPLESEPRQHLRNKVPAADKEPLAKEPAPEGAVGPVPDE